MTKVTVISHYPLSRSFGEAIERLMGGEARFVTLGELRQEGFAELWRRVRSIGPGALAIGLEDPTSVGALPILRLVASATNARRLSVVDPNLQKTDFSRLGEVGHTAQFALACLAGFGAAAWSSRGAARLAREERIQPRRWQDRKLVSYLNTNLWFGTKAGGSVGHISGVANGLMDHGYDLDYFSVGGRLLIRNTARSFELAPPRVFALPFQSNLFRFDRSLEPQVLPKLELERTAFLYQRLSLSNFAGVRISRRTSLPLVVEYNGSEVWVADNWGRGLPYAATAARAEEQTLRHAHLVVTISDVLRDELIERGIEPERIVTYPNCIDPGVFDPARFPSSEISALRANHGIAEDAVLATFVGTFGAWHGAEVFAEAIRELVEVQGLQLAASKLRFLFVGDGLRMAAVRKIIDEGGCGGVTHFTGLVPQDQAPAFLAASDILVSPHVSNSDGSRFFGSPTKLFEYLAMQKAVVASDLDQIGEVLRNSLRAPLPAVTSVDSELAVLTPPGDATVLATTLLQVAQRRELREALGRNARREALAKYTWRRHVKEILDGLGRAQP